MRRLDIAHGDRAADGGAEAPTGDFADLAAAAVLNLGMVAGRLLAFGQDSHALAFGSLGQLLLDDRGTGKSAILAPACADAPGEPRLDRCRRRVDVVSVKAKACLQPQRIPRTEADRLYLRHLQQPARQRLGMIVGHGAFETVFAGVAGAGDKAARAFDYPESAAHELHLAAVGYEARQRVDSGWSLERQKRTLAQILDIDIGGNLFSQMCLVLFLAAGIDDEEEMIAEVGHHQI